MRDAVRELSVLVPQSVLSALARNNVSIDDIDFSWLLGYVDFSRPEIMDAMVLNASSAAEKLDPIVKVRIASYNLECMNQGLKALSGEYHSVNKISDEIFSGMMSVALGFIDFDKYVKPRP